MSPLDLVIIGAGPAGYVAAIRASQLGMKVAVIDERDLPGGTCLNVGCIPSKSLLHASGLYNEMRHKGEPFGLMFDGASIDFSKMQKFKESVVDSLGHGVLSLFEKNGVRFIKGKAVLQDAHTIEVEGELLKAERILLATGSLPRAFEDLPFDEKRVLSSTGALNLDHIPQSMIVVGAGVIGLELASVYQRLGTHLTILEATATVCPFLDSDLSVALARIMRMQGLEILVNAEIQKINVTDKVSVEVDIKGEKRLIEAETILVAIGRKAASEGLGLEKVGVKVDNQGRVLINDRFQTSVPSIFAVGDLVEGPMLAHKASEEALVVVETMAGIDSNIHYASIPNVIYTHPEVASVGFSEAEVRAAHGNCLTGVFPIRFNSRAKCSDDLDGLVKVVADSKTHRILGIHIVSAAASEMISVGVICIRSAMTLEELCQAPQAHPTLSESIREAAFKALGKAIHQ